MSKTVNCKLEKVCLEGKGSIISGPFGSNISKKYLTNRDINSKMYVINSLSLLIL